MDQLLLQKWEYRIEQFDDIRDTKAISESLSRLGAEGWELVSISGGSTADTNSTAKTLRRRTDPYRAFFKRPAS